MSDLNFEHLAKVEFKIGAQYQFGKTAFAARGCGVLESGTIKGEKIDGVLVGPCADWAFIGEDGFVLGDIRANWKMDDGSFILMEYQAKLNSPSEPAYSAVNFSGGSEKYMSLNRKLIIGKGSYDSEAQMVKYDLYLVS